MYLMQVQICGESKIILSFEHLHNLSHRLLTTSIGHMQLNSMLHALKWYHSL